MAFKILSEWDYEMDGVSSAPTIYRSWYESLEELTWKDELGLKNEKYLWPYQDKMLELILSDPESHWFDNITTSQTESFVDICRSSFYNAINKLHSRFGEKIQKDWTWSKYRGTDINHLANIPGLGKVGLHTSGGLNVPNATRKTFGPSWRFVIEMAEEKKVYGIYPGGQSGFPGSKYYDNMIDDWVEGNSYPLSFPIKPENISGITITLRAGE
ncbi:uncharacterized protein METZ01_LOCUS377718 [marine metagenome]|uniref:Penicillin amidase n=1 Tax=marine metagenome TaxID=408172 RepID=A0A382TS02_9ZZZZ